MTTDTLTTGQPKIAGYRNLSEAEIALMNRIKAHASETQKLVEAVYEHISPLAPGEDHLLPAHTSPARWAMLAMGDLQQGYMALSRAVARPTNF